ncbi:MAG: dTDP-4-dehydrorhamnose reductase [Acidobacteria bacterium]|nr:dTDP-4-dehydrorhamnose reductase [Acidobacteriota bacterium]
MSKKVAIFGGAGQVGVELVREFSSRGYSVTALDRPSVDITDSHRVEQRLTRLDPQIVVNAAAYNQVDVAEQEPQQAFVVNALAVRTLAVVCRQLDARLVHFSTDYVFDGKAARPYTEEDPTHPLNAYAVSKLSGEVYAQAYLENCTIVRTSGVFRPGGLQTARGNFIELMLRLAGSGQAVRLVDDHIASPTYAPVLAARTVDLVEGDHNGLFHLGGGTPISWYHFAEMIFRLANIQPELRPTKDQEYRTAARRPKYSALSNAKVEALGLAPMPPLEQAVKSYLAIRSRTLAASPV